VGPGANVAFYRLVFISDGLVIESEVVAQVPGVETPPAVPDITICVRVEGVSSMDSLDEGNYSIRSCHGTYITASPGGDGASVTLQATPGVWTLVRAPGGCYGLRSVHGTYLRAFPGGEGSKVDLHLPPRSLNDKSSWRGQSWEQFVLVPTEDGKFGLRSHHGTYVRAHPGLKLDIQTDKLNWSAMPWEQFVFQQLN